MKRRDFIGSLGAMAFSGGLQGCAVQSSAPSRGVGGGRLYGALLHLGGNMWSDRPHPLPADDRRRFPFPDYLTKTEIEKNKLAHSMGGRADSLRFDDGVWRRVTSRMASLGMTFVMIDIGEGFRYPSHPEIAARDAWDVDRMARELERLRAMGLMPVPKLNFSTTHSAWMGEMRLKTSSPEYYRFVSEVICDVCEVFRPECFHIGYDEEDEAHQFGYIDKVVRDDETWWHDLLFTVRAVERLGVRAWMWSDKIWHCRDEFVKRCPQSVLQSNWYYLDDFNPKESLDPRHKASLYPMVHAYEWLDAAGFDQVPTTSCCGNWGLLATNPRLTAAYVRKHVDASRLKGLMMAPWFLTMEPFEADILRGLDQTVPAVELLGWNEEPAPQHRPM